MSNFESRHRQPIITLGTPDHDVTNRAALWALIGVAFMFLLCILAYAVAGADDGAALGADAPAERATVVTIDEWAGGGS